MDNIPTNVRYAPNQEKPLSAFLFFTAATIIGKVPTKKNPFAIVNKISVAFISLPPHTSSLIRIPGNQ